MLGVYNFTVVLTYLSMLSAYLGISMAMGGNIRGALFCLMLSGFCDMFDGKVASLKKDRTQKERRFGIQIDSLSDVISFGVLPAIIVYQASKGSGVAFYVSGIYALCALIRLAWFNVDEEERQMSSTDERKYYLGLPVTTAAILVPIFLGLSMQFHWRTGVVGPLLLSVMAIAFLTPFKLKKPALPGKIFAIICGFAELFILLAGLS